GQVGLVALGPKAPHHPQRVGVDAVEGDLGGAAARGPVVVGGGLRLIAGGVDRRYIVTFVIIAVVIIAIVVIAIVVIAIVVIAAVGGGLVIARGLVKVAVVVGGGGVGGEIVVVVHGTCGCFQGR